MWLHGRLHDTVLAFLWVPFAVVALVVADDPTRLPALVAATLLLSFAHQPLTLWLAYGDAAQRRAAPHILAWAPPVALLAVHVGTSVQPDAVALVAGVWNLVHTMRQRYGISRLYGRMVDLRCGEGDNRLLWSWLALAVVVAVATTDLGAAATSAGLSGRTATAVDLLARARAAGAAVVPLVAAVAGVVTYGWLRTEIRRTAHNPARLLYLGATAGLLVLLAADPVAGFVAYVGAHAVEYLLVVRWRVTRAARAPRRGDLVGALGGRIGGSGTLAVYALAVGTLIVALRQFDGSDVVVSVAVAIGALHLLYDGVVWRSRPDHQEIP